MRHLYDASLNDGSFWRYVPGMKSPVDDMTHEELDTDNQKSQQQPTMTVSNQYPTTDTSQSTTNTYQPTQVNQQPIPNNKTQVNQQPIPNNKTQVNQQPIPNNKT